MKLVIIESPFSAPTEAEMERNHIYLQLCIRDSILRGESPYASHQMLTEALSEETERDIGINAGYAWWRVASAVAFYTDLGWSKGMFAAQKFSKTARIAIEERSVTDLRHTELAVR